MSSREDLSEPELNRAINRIKSLGGSVELRRDKLGQLVVTDIRLRGSDVTDGTLKYLSLLLRCFGTGGTTLTSGLAHLIGLASFEELDLSACRITDGDLVGMPSLDALRFLDISWTRVSDSGLEHLRPLVGLRRVRAVGSLVTKQGAWDFEDRFPGKVHVILEDGDPYMDDYDDYRAEGTGELV